MAELVDFTAILAQFVDPLGRRVDFPGVVATLFRFHILLKLLEVECVLHSELFQGRLFQLILSELGLHVLEKLAGADLDVEDFDSDEMDAPACDHFTHFSDDTVSQLTPVLDDVVDGRIGDHATHDGTGHALKDTVCSLVRVARQVEILVRFKGIVLVHGPLDHRRDLESLHLLGHLIRRKLDLDVFGWELSHRVVRALEAVEATAGLDGLAVTHNDHPLVRVPHDPLRHGELVDPQSCLVEEVEGYEGRNEANNCPQ